MDAGRLGESFDPLAPDQMDNPFPVYARARREEPVFYSKKYDVWVVTRYGDLSTVLRDPVRFSSANALEAKTEPSPEVRAVLVEMAANASPVRERLDALMNVTLAAGHRSFTLRGGLAHE